MSVWNSILSENIFKNREEMNFFRHSKIEKMNCQQNCIIRNTERSPLGIMKMISGANPYIHKGTKSTKMVNMWVNMKYGCVSAKSLSPVHQLFVIPRTV